MVVALEDDDCIHVYHSVDFVVLQVEALDAEGCLRAVFDCSGQRYKIDWIRPNKRGWLGSRENGEYRLVPDGEPDPAALLSLLEAKPVVFPESDRPDVRALKDRLRAER